jgi:hypothetical protein
MYIIEAARMNLCKVGYFFAREVIFLTKEILLFVHKFVIKFFKKSNV